MNVFKFSWLLFLYICTLDILIKEYEGKRLNPYQESQIPPINNFLLQKLPYRHSAQKLSAFFEYSFKKSVDFINLCIQKARPDEDVFFSDITARFDLKQFLINSLSEEVVTAFNEIISVCRRRILVALDGFDTAFDEFRQISIQHYSSSNLLEERSRLEIEWVRTLLHLVMEIKHDYRGTNPFYNLLDFCLTIPKDRFLEIMERERDSYIYHSRYIELNWSGLELAILLRRRLEVLTSYKTNEKLNVEERLSQVIEKKYPNIPKESYVSVGGKTYRMPLFLYVLRHTFWRPRDILFYYARILAVARDMHKRNHEMTGDVVRRIVKDTTIHVINSEFINEFKSTLINIKEIIDTFIGYKQILSYNELQDALSKIHFKFSHKPEEVKDFKSKVIFLYEIGFLGFEVNEEMKNRYSIECKQAFYFNEGEIPLRIINTPHFDKCSFVIHPIFCEYLQLDISKQDVTLYFNWEYLHKMELLLFAP